MANIEPETLLAVAKALNNIDATDLAVRGLISLKEDGSPSEGGNDWSRFCNDPSMFIVKMDQGNLQKMADLVSAYMPSADGGGDVYGR